MPLAVVSVSMVWSRDRLDVRGNEVRNVFARGVAVKHYR